MILTKKGKVRIFEFMGENQIVIRCIETSCDNKGQLELSDFILPMNYCAVEPKLQIVENYLIVFVCSNCDGMRTVSNDWRFNDLLEEGEDYISYNDIEVKI